MACRKSRGSIILLCLGLLVFASSFCLCTKLTKLKVLDKLSKNSTLSKGQAKARDLQHGRLLIGQTYLPDDKLNGVKATKNFLDVDTDYQEDMGWEDPKQLQRRSDGFSKPDNAAMEQLLLMDPKVECTGDSMKLQVQNAASTPGSLFVDRGSHLSPLALSKLPPSCGYTIRSTQRELVLVAPYDGCFVALEEDSYVLPMLWLGLNVRMSCPLMKLSSPNPPMVTCHAEGMVVKTGWTVSIAKINVKLNGNWEPLMKASPRCGFSVVVHPEGVVLSVRYTPCMEKKDGMYTLQLAGEGETKMSCPSLPWPQASPQQEPFYPQPETKNPAAAPSLQQTRGPQGQVQPPFYPYPFYPQPETENPTAAPRPQTKAPPGQVQPPFYPHPFYPQPETENPTAAPSLQPTRAPQGQVQPPFYPHPFYPQPETENPTAAPSLQQTRAHQGQEQTPFYPYPFYPQPETENPAAAPRPSQNKAPQGQEQPPFYPYPFYPQPEIENPAAAPRPSQNKAPRGQEQPPFYPYPFYPQPETENPAAAPRPSQTKAPRGQEQPPFYPYPFYPQPETENPAAAPRPSQNKAPRGQEQPPFYPYPFYPQPETENPAAAPRPSQTKAPRGQEQPPFYPYPFYPQPETENPAAAPRPSQNKAPRGQEQPPFYPYPFYPQPETENPAAAPRPSQTKAPRGQEQPPFYPYPFYPQPETENPAAAPRPSQNKAPRGQVRSFYPYPFQPEIEKNPQPVTSPSATTMQQPQRVITHSDQPPLESTIPQTSNSDVVPQGPQLGSPYMLPVYCPQFCPSGISNCCPQIAFHHHYIIPAGLGRDAPSLYPGLPFLSLAYSGFGSLNSDPLPQKPTKTMMQATTTSISAPISSQSQNLPSGNEKFPQPPDGNPAVLNHPSKPSSFDRPIYPFVPNSLYPYWPYVPQNEALQRIPQSQSPAHYNVLSKPQAPGSKPLNPMLQYNEQSPPQQHGQLLAWDINNPSGPNFVSSSGQYLHQPHMAKQQNTPTAEERQQSNKASKSRLVQSQVQSELDRHLVHNMLQNAQAQTYDKTTAPNNASQPDHQTDSYSEPKSYLLLQHGPPGRKSNRFNESPLPSKDLVRDADLHAHNRARHHSSKPQDDQSFKPPQENPQHPKMLGKGMSHPLPDVNYTPRPGDESSFHFIPLNGAHSVPLSQDPFVGGAHSNPKFKNLWRPMTPSL